MKRTRLFALLAIAALTLFASAPAAASPPLAFEHPLNLVAAQPLAVDAAVVASAQLLVAIQFGCEQIDGDFHHADASVPGVKRIGKAPDRLFVDSVVRPAPNLPVARAVRA